MNPAQTTQQFRDDLKLNTFIDPKYVRISRIDFAQMLGISIAQLDRYRRNDPECPKGFKTGDGRLAPVKFVLADCYTYSAHLTKQDIERTENEEREKAAIASTNISQPSPPTQQTLF